MTARRFAVKVRRMGDDVGVTICEIAVDRGGVGDLDSEGWEIVAVAQSRRDALFAAETWLLMERKR